MQQRSSSRIATSRDLALTGLSLALWTAAAHLIAVVAIRAFTRDEYWSWSSRDVWWMVPLSYVLWFVAPVVVLVLVNLIAPQVARRHWIFGFLAAWGLLAVALLYTRAYPWALGLLALGIGARFSAFYRDHESALTRVLRFGAACAAAFTLLAAGSTAWRLWKEQRTLARIPENEGAPNVLLIILDTVRGSSMSLYGSPRSTTPRLTAWAQRGVTFDQAYATSSWTLPSHGSMFSGVYASEQSADWVSRFDGTHRTLAEAFRARNYATGAFVANLIYAGHSTGLSRGFTTYEDTRRSLTEAALNTTFSQSNAVSSVLTAAKQRWLGGMLQALLRFDLRPASHATVHQHKAAADVVEPFLRWQDSLGDRPFFAFLNLFDAHEPQLTREPYRSMFDKGRLRRDNYDGALRYLDDQVSDLLDELERRDVLRRTIVVVTSDHGELFGEHGLTWHGNSLYREALRVPLIIINGDSVAAGRRIAAQVSLRDLGATILDLARQPEGEPFPGYSLVPLWNQESAPRSTVVAELSQSIRSNERAPSRLGDMQAVLDDSLHIIRNGDGSFDAFAYRVDTAEAHDLAEGDSASIAQRFNDLYQRALKPSHVR